MVKLDLLLATLRANAAQQTTWRDAQALRQRGLDAEQNLDLDTARQNLALARDALETLGAEWLDPDGLAEMNLELARCQDEAGDGTAARAALRRWAEETSAELDERSFAPPFVALSKQVRTEVTTRRPSVPMTALWSTNAIDEIVVVNAAGLPGAEDVVLLLYRRGATHADRVASASRVGSTTDKQAWLQRAVQILFEMPTVPSSGAASGVGPMPANSGPNTSTSTTTVPAANETNLGIVGQVGFIFPEGAMYSRYGVNTLGFGLRLAVRVVTPSLPMELGGRLEFVGGNFGIFQLTPTARWSWRKGAWGFGLEPGLFIQTRSGDTHQPAFDANGVQIQNNQSDVLFGLVGGALIDYHLNERWAIEEELNLSAILASEYDLNLLIAFHTSLSVAF